MAINESDIGRVNAAGKYSGALGVLQQRNVDVILASFSITPQRHEHFAFPGMMTTSGPMVALHNIPPPWPRVHFTSITAGLPSSVLLLTLCAIIVALVIFHLIAGVHDNARKRLELAWRIVHFCTPGHNATQMPIVERECS